LVKLKTKYNILHYRVLQVTLEMSTLHVPCAIHVLSLAVSGFACLSVAYTTSYRRRVPSGGSRSKHRSQRSPEYHTMPIRTHVRQSWTYTDIYFLSLICLPSMIAAFRRPSQSLKTLRGASRLRVLPRAATKQNVTFARCHCQREMCTRLCRLCSDLMASEAPSPIASLSDLRL